MWSPPTWSVIGIWAPEACPPLELWSPGSRTPTPVPPTITVAARTPARTLAVMSATRIQMGAFVIHRRTVPGLRGSVAVSVVVGEVVLFMDPMVRAGDVLMV
jgi:hypothetical protein